ncbi:hypothetical protein ACWG0P_10285 [Amedibacillus sp. YH-ame6]
MKLEGYIACICEGSAEQAIIELLLDENKLTFKKEDMLEEKILRCRDAKKFSEKYLRKNFDDEKITILRILDSRKERFNLPKAYQSKVNVINIITAPEIEMLVVFRENKYNEYKRSKKKPSDFCKVILGYDNVKSAKFIRQYFQDIDSLILAVQEYRRVSKIDKGEYSLCDLLDI